MKYFLLILFFLTSAFAMDLPNPTAESPSEETVSEEKPTRATKEIRQDSIGTIMLGFQLLNTWIPFKKTISYTHIFNKKWSIEGEYGWSTLNYPVIGVDLGRITERRTSLMAKYYRGNSFHFIFGAFYNDFEAQVGSDILNNVTDTRTTSSFDVEGPGLMAGLGNRWQWENGLTLGVDWFRLNVPLVVTKVDSEILNDVSGDDEEDIRKVIRVFSRIPTFVLLGINIGYSF